MSAYAASLQGERVRITGGRRVGLLTLGDPDGTPVMLFHGEPGSRFGYELMDAPARERGVRLLCVERPGIGLSDPKDGHSVTGWAADTSALADALGIGRFAILAHSSGAPYALACGALIPDRVMAVGIMAGGGPLDRPGAVDSLSPTARRVLSLAPRFPLLAWLMLGSMGVSAKLTPSLARRGFLASVSAPDRRALEPQGPAVTRFMTQAFRQGPAGSLAHFRLWPLPWAFDLGSVAVPVRMWYGDDDRFVGADHGEDLATRLPDATMTVLADTGHFSIMEHADSILDGLLTAGR